MMQTSAGVLFYLYSLYITRYIIIYGVYPSEKIVHETGFSKKVRYLHKYGDIDKVEQDDWLLRIAKVIPTPI